MTNNQLSFDYLLNKDNSVSIHIRNIERLAIQMFKFYNGLSLQIMNNVIKLKTENSYNIRQLLSFLGQLIRLYIMRLKVYQNSGYTARKIKEYRKSRKFQNGDYNLFL